MSTIFKSLLSKTLTTFLYKYLSDVDVEGIALPSVIDGSGWGVRLSNVKLREGVQLMKQMPGTKIGKRKRTRIVKRKKQPTKQEEASPKKQEESTTSDINRATVASLSAENGTARDPPLETPPPSVTVSETAPDDESIQLEEAMQPYHDEGPSTPPQGSKSILSCFYNSASTRKIALEKSEESLPELPLLSVNGEQQPKQERQVEMESQAQASSFADHAKKTGYIQEVEDEYEEYEEVYEEEYEQQLTLCLGENGTIGTLDVR
jgi:hypothetical protein